MYQMKGENKMATNIDTNASLITVKQNMDSVFLTHATSAQLKALLEMIPQSRLKIICKKTGIYSHLYEVRLRGVQYAL